MSLDVETLAASSTRNTMMNYFQKLFAVSVAAGAGVLPTQAGIDETTSSVYYSVSITADGYYEADSKLRREKIKTDDVIGALLENFGHGNVRAKDCKLIAGVTARLADAQLNIEEIRWYLYCKKQGINIDVTADTEDDDGVWMQPGNRYWEVAEFSVQGSGTTVTGKRNTRFTFLQFGMSLSFLDLFSAQQGDFRTELKDSELSKISFKGNGFHNLSVTDDTPSELLGKLDLKITKREKNYEPPGAG